MPPQQEMEGVRAQIAEAESSGAPTYAKAAWDEANVAILEVEEEIRRQDSKFALFRSYTKTKALIAEAKEKAARARWQAVANREMTNHEAREALAVARANLSHANQLFVELGASRRQPSAFKGDMESLKAELEKLEFRFMEVEEAIAAGDAFDAKAQAEELGPQVDALILDLEAGRRRIDRGGSEDPAPPCPPNTCRCVGSGDCSESCCHQSRL